MQTAASESVSPLVRPPDVGCHVPIDRRQRMGESVPLPGRTFRIERGRISATPCRQKFVRYEKPAPARASLVFSTGIEDSVLTRCSIPHAGADQLEVTRKLNDL